MIERAVTLSDSDTFTVDESWLKREPTEAPHSIVALDGDSDRPIAVDVRVVADS